ncbi:NADH-quinone oxidoreductase subunit L [Celerinatantimonas sp. YJH-8]|uniref:NADH-quinone oxidoreductase subunit L n=1 Tax=Celerinatantimonas sp. YJH-8 TaxID=3228714 RepID=UPI0038C587C7
MFSLFLITPLKLMLLGLVAILGFTIFRYSWVAFSGQADRGRFLRALMMTIAAVVMVIISNHMLLFWAAWISVSLSLHRLILFYPQRPRAQLAAHKKFLLARLSELLLGVALLLLYLHFQTPYISAIIKQVPTAGSHLDIHITAVLLALVALIKCAQLPIHGWLIQVVEAPTPVSALLHAGIVNLGGILLLFFAPVLAASSAACWLLIVWAGISTVIAGLVSTTRISIKVKLAWSTSSQMGLMLVEIALGLYEMALLHLFAHSFYKAYSFLNSGSTVNSYLSTQLSGECQPKVRHWVFALVLAMTILSMAQWQFTVTQSLAATMLVLFALSALILPSVTRWDRASPVRILITLIVACALLTFYTTAKHHLMVLMGLDAPLDHAADTWVAMLFIALFAFSIALQYWPHIRWVKRLFIWLNAGAYLDEWATRLTLKLWPSQSLLKLQHAHLSLNSEVKS